jgi:peptidoglycan-N-acetylglucosamine deacetylase
MLAHGGLDVARLPGAWEPRVRTGSGSRYMLARWGKWARPAAAGLLPVLAGLALVLTGGEARAEPCKRGLETSRTLSLTPGQRAGAPALGPSMLADKEIVLSFDDGPNPWTTPRILEILAENCIKATFFTPGEAAADHPSLVEREIAEGHAVGGHTWSHAKLPTLAFDAAVKQVEGGFVPLEAAGIAPHLFRYPNLAETPELNAWLKRKGVSVIGVDIEPMDWAGDAPEVTLARFKAGLDASGRGIVLLHDSQPNTVKLLPDLLELLRSGGYRIVHLQAASGG